MIHRTSIKKGFTQHHFIFRKRKSGAGFTLVELLLYIALTTVMIATVSGYIYLTLQARVKGQVIAEVEQQGIQAIQNMTQIIRNATGVNSPALGASGSSTSVTVLNFSNSPTVFNVVAGVFRITEGAKTPVPLTNDRVTVSAFTVTNVSQSTSSNTLRLQFTLTAVNPNGRSEYSYAKTFTTTADLRR